MLLCEKDKIYTGITKDVEKRFLTHLNGTKHGGAKYTNANKPIKILYKKSFETKSEALKEEIRIKKLTHKEKIALLDKELT